MEPEVGHSLTHARSALEDADWVTGDHRPEGVIVATGPSVTAFEQPPMLIDMAPTILAALQAPASIEHTGRVLHEVVGADVAVGSVRRSRPRPSPPFRYPRHADGRRGVGRLRGGRDGGAPAGFGYLE